MQKFSKKKWVKFAQDTVAKDGLVDVPDFKAFGELMDTLYKSGAPIPYQPIGECDRVWVRVYMATHGAKRYATVFKTAEAVGILNYFHKHD
jgi:hypothetical protein